MIDVRRVIDVTSDTNARVRASDGVSDGCEMDVRWM